MWKVLNFVGIIFFGSSYVLCFAQLNNTFHDETPLKITLVEEIVRKVCNVSLETFSNKDPVEKTNLMIKIEEKLNKSAHSLGPHGEKYVQLIMKGVKSKAFGNKIVESKSNQSISEITNTLRQLVEPAQQTNITKKTKSKNKMVNDIARKIELLAKTYLKEAKTKEERQQAIKHIKEKFIESADRKHAMLHSKHQEIKTYVDLVAKGIDILMRETEKSKSNQRRRMEFVFTDNININKNKQHTSEQFEPIKGNSLFNNELDNGVKHATIEPISVFLKTKNVKDLKTESSCNEALKETCNKVNLVKKIRCETDNREIIISKLCDGLGDCLDFSDERRCATHAIDIIQSANRLMQHIDTYLSQNCYSDLMHKSTIAKQSQILNDVLQNQLTFLHSHALQQNSSVYSKRVLNSDAQTVKNTVNEAVTVVDTLATALQSSLCLKFRDVFRKNGDEELDREDLGLQTSTWSPEHCKCNGPNCIIKSCSTRCEEVCFQKYSLSQWQCSAVTGERYVSLDMICDGKLDCYDETDESGCSDDIGLIKFEATKMYEYILDMITTKASTVVFEAVRNRLLNLHALVTKLQKLSLKRHTDIIEVKRVRDKSFAELTAIYDSAAHYIYAQEESVDMYVFLLTLNERLMSALKKSHTGNDKIISPDGCVCRGYQCVLPRCSKSCTRACSAEPKLTRYFCGGSTETNNSIPIELICNGKNNCPKGDDENDCQKDVCRKHHLVLLRHNLRDAGLAHQGTSLGEALRSWRVKVTATLKISETNDRPIPAVLRDIVHDILHDLVMTYATVEDRHRSDTSTVFQEFYQWSRVVIDILRSCGK